MKHKNTNQVIVLAKKPTGNVEIENFRLEETEIPEMKQGEVLLESLFISVDPGMRGFMNKDENDDRGNKFNINEPITSRTVAKVIKSSNQAFSEGSIVYGRLAWKKIQAVATEELEKINPDLAPISTALSILGVPGLAAYFGMLNIAKIKKGDTVVVSGAAGAVGNIAAQIAKLKGCYVVGIAGSDAKIEYLQKDLGLDKAINYKTVADLKSAIAEACPNGVDVFFDNVGGDVFDAVFTNISKHCRIAICGQIAEYNEANPPKGKRPQHGLIKYSARMEGFVVFDFRDEFAEAKKQLASWYNSGALKYRENLIEGFQNLPSAFVGLFSGENIGKQLVKI